MGGLPGQGTTLFLPESSGTNPYGSSNQYFSNMPSLPGASGMPSASPAASPYGPQSNAGPSSSPSPFNPSGSPTVLPTATSTGQGQIFGGSPVSPAFTNQLLQWLSSQMGKGATPFGGSVVLPSSGQSTTPGATSAPMTPELAALQQFFLTGNAGGQPGLQGLQSMANGVNTLPAWQAMVAAQQQNIQRNQADLKGQFAFSGNLQGSPFGDAMSHYESQTTADQNALLANTTLQGMGLQEQAGSTLLNASTQLGQLFQGMDQTAVQNALQEFIRTQPEYSPLLNAIFGLGTSYPPYMSKTSGVGLGGVLGSAAISALGPTAGKEIQKLLGIGQTPASSVIPEGQLPGTPPGDITGGLSTNPLSLPASLAAPSIGAVAGVGAGAGAGAAAPLSAAVSSSVLPGATLLPDAAAGALDLTGTAAPITSTSIGALSSGANAGAGASAGTGAMSGLGAAATVIAPLAAGIGVGELVLSLLDSNGVTVKDAAAMNKSLDSTDKTLASSWQQAAQTALTPGATQSGYGPAFATQMINQQMKSYSQELSDAFKWGFITKNQMAAKLANLTVAYNQSMALLQGGK